MGELQLCWTGDIEQLKQFVSENIELSGVWNSPGGDKKTYSDGYTSISWRKGKKVLQIEGREKNQIKTKLCSLICDVHSDVLTTDTSDTNVESIVSSVSSVSSPTISDPSTEMEGVKLDITIAEREIYANKYAINDIEDRLNKMSGDFEDVKILFENCRKEMDLLHNQHLVQSSPLSEFEYSNLVDNDKSLPKETSLCHDKATSTLDLHGNTGICTDQHFPALISIQAEQIADSNSKLDIQLAEYREKHQQHQNYEQSQGAWRKPKRTCAPHILLPDTVISVHTNSFELLEIDADVEENLSSNTELEENLSPNFDHQITNYRVAHKINHKKFNKPNLEHDNETRKCEVQSGVLLIGDSMIKHIDGKKLKERLVKKRLAIPIAEQR